VQAVVTLFNIRKKKMTEIIQKQPDDSSYDDILRELGIEEQDESGDVRY
jgi:hypothetical protein